MRVLFATALIALLLTGGTSLMESYLRVLPGPALVVCR